MACSSVVQEGPPLVAVWEVTRAGARPGRHVANAGRELDTDEGFALLDRLAALGVPRVTLTADDPARRGDLADLARHGARAGLALTIELGTSAAMPRALLEDLATAGRVGLAVPIDGPTADVHDAFHDQLGAFEQSLRVLREARAVGLTTQVTTALHAAILEDLDALAELVGRLSAATWTVSLPTTARSNTGRVLGPRTVEHALDELADIAAMSGFTVRTADAPQYRRVTMMRRRRRGDGPVRDLVEGPRALTEGSGMLYVSPSGEVCPGESLPLAAGNVHRDDVGDVYRDAPLFRALRDTDALRGKCGRCPFRRVCGGSRGRAYAMRADVMSEDPLCAYQPPRARP
jgi:radical SAM protein with 4Fe4S-binding SPASM domain